MSEIPFRRMILRFPQSVPSAAALRIVAGLANDLRLELLGQFVPDRNLMYLRQHPLAREYRLHERKWSYIEQVDYSDQLHETIRIAERSFTELLHSVEISGRFEVAAGLPAGVEEDIHADDIVVVCEPENPMDQLGLPFLSAVEAALGAPGAVMIVPRRAGRGRGCVAALAAGSSDPVIAAAKEIAAAARERCLTVALREGGDVRSVTAELAQTAPRLVLVSRGALDGHEARVLWELASACQAPVLAIRSA